jgi:hypothetical protein
VPVSLDVGACSLKRGRRGQKHCQGSVPPGRAQRPRSSRRTADLLTLSRSPGDPGRPTSASGHSHRKTRSFVHVTYRGALSSRYWLALGPHRCGPAYGHHGRVIIGVALPEVQHYLGFTPWAPPGSFPACHRASSEPGRPLHEVLWLRADPDVRPTVPVDHGRRILPT